MTAARRADVRCLHLRAPFPGTMGRDTATSTPDHLILAALTIRTSPVLTHSTAPVFVRKHRCRYVQARK